ncbi:hypothetical protein Naga_100879g1 [Nannochloropsis gaditana]|uniref:Uncharacterized protein n=1 Tax=Nannochloropsis gaditana TaxID=72520 RepID=W7TSB2_9STRA|nr:hypothetical protein Naga_100879g1 [Nannochloropsis gaditana]
MSTLEDWLPSPTGRSFVFRLFLDLPVVRSLLLPARCPWAYTTLKRCRNPPHLPNPYPYIPPTPETLFPLFRDVSFMEVMRANSCGGS